MAGRRPGGREVKREIRRLLASGDTDRAVEVLCRMPGRRAVGPLFGLLLSTEPPVRWAAVLAMGAVVARMAGEDMEAARVVMRRFMWQLNDESGGIGWGCPEAMGEVMARHGGLAREFSPILVSYIREDGNYLEYPPLQEGALWGVGRLAEVRPGLLGGALPHLPPFLVAPEPALRGLAAWIAGLLGARALREALQNVADDSAAFGFFRKGRLVETTVGGLARESLLRLK